MLTRTKIAYILSIICACLFLWATFVHLLPLDITEALGFVTGLYCVWLTVKENIWNWPLGIANSAFLLIVFARAHLYADSALQVIYIVLGFLGWYWWLYGGEEHKRLTVRTSTARTILTVCVIVACSTYGMTHYLESVNDAAPFLDALTTCLSLAAQYLLTRKLIENWYFWITADVIYIYLYMHRELYLTSLLYVLFLMLCILGVRQWRKALQSATVAA